MTATGAEVSGPNDATRAYSLAAMAPEPFDKYTLIGRLGRGGMAEVNLAVVEGKGNFRKLVVVKRLHPHLAEEPGFIEMFLDEARLAARLSHPHVVQTHEVGEWEASHFLAMEYLDGQGLERVLRMCGQRGAPIPFEIGARIVSDALDGLAYAHDATDFDGTPLGVVHRDVSPQNIFVTYNGVVKLLDFGIAKAATHVVETRTGVIKGKYAYIAPEQALAEHVDHRADLWSMGVVLWEVLTGRRLFKSVNELATLHETLQGEVKLPSAFRPELPTELDTICMRALEREVGQRYESAHEMKEDLDRYLASLPRSPGTKHVARFMRERFAEVIEVHKQTLARCLDGGGALEISPSNIQRLVDSPMTTPTGARGNPSVTPTPTPSHVAARSFSPLSSDEGVVVAPPPERQKSGAFWKVAAIVLAGLLAGLLAFLIPSGEADPASSAPSAPERSARMPIEPPVATPAPAPIAPAPIEAVETEEPVVERDEREAAREAAREARARRARRARRERRREAQEPEPAEVPAPAEEVGFLSLVTTPWTRVHLGERDLGTTPLIRLELPAGTHTLRLENAAEGIEQTYRVTIRAGETTARRLGLR